MADGTRHTGEQGLLEVFRSVAAGVAVVNCPVVPESLFMAYGGTEGEVVFL
jgi:hypothetical protein